MGFRTVVALVLSCGHRVPATPMRRSRERVRCPECPPHVGRRGRPEPPQAQTNCRCCGAPPAPSAALPDWCDACNTCDPILAVSDLSWLGDECPRRARAAGASAGGET